MSNSNTTDHPENNALIRGIDALVREDPDGDGDESVNLIDRVSYRYFGEWFKARGEQYKEYQQIVNQARLEDTWEEHLAKTVFLTLLIGGAGAVTGMVLGAVLSMLGVWGMVSVPLSLQLKKILGTLGIMLVGGAVGGGVTFGILYTKPRREAYRRKREITQLLPQTITYIYAHSQGGMHLVDIIERLANEEQAYGEVAREFQAIHNSMAFFGADMTTALQEARTSTPNNDLATLLDDFVSYVNTGGDLSSFLEKKTREFQRKARRREELVIEQMDLVAQIYLVLGVALPLIALVTFVVMTAMGGAPMSVLYLVVYFAMPVLGVLFIVIHDSLTADAADADPTLTPPTSPPTPEEINARLNEGADPAEAAGSEANRHRTTASARPVYSRIDGHDEQLSPAEKSGLLDIRKALKRERVMAALKLPVTKVRERPTFTAVFTVPAVIVYLGALHLLSVISVSPAGITNAPIWTTTTAIVLPLLLVFTPISYLHERQYRYQQQVNKELPDTLRKLATVNTTGANLIENMRLVSTSSTGILADELGKTHHNLQWNVSLNDALKRFANRVENPRVTRVTKLLIESNTTSGRVTEVLTVAADAAQDRMELNKQRFNAMRQKMAVILLGYLIFLGVTVTVMVWLFPTFSEAAASTDTQTAQGGGITALNFPSKLYRMVFYHGVIMQAVIGGAVAGKFGYGSVRSGLKYAIGGIVLATVVFHLV